VNCGKNGYPDKRAAITAMNAALSRRRNRPDYLRPYFCDRCRKWHLTHKPPGIRSRMMKWTRPAGKTWIQAEQRPLSAAHAGDPLAATFSGHELPGDGSVPTRIMWMPAGVNEISCLQNGKTVRTFVLVNQDTARVAQHALESLNSESEHKPYFDFGHAHKEASAWPKRFLWSDAPRPGVYADVEWSDAGLAAVAGKRWRSFSPQFYTDRFPFSTKRATKADPARVVDAPLNMGGLVNDPAFRAQAPLFAARARGDLADNTPEVTPMSDATKLELAAKQSRVEELETEIEALKAQAAESDQTEALKAKENELIETQQKLDALQAENTARAKRDAKACVSSAVTRGAIAASNTALQQHWQRLIEADAKNAELLNAMPGSAALAAGRMVRPKVSIEKEDTNDVLRAYLSAGRDPRKRGDIYRKELDPLLEKGERIAFERLPTAALSAANSLGTLVGDIVSQRTLATLVSRRPQLSQVVTDFSDEQARLNQTVYTRAVGLPTVQNFGGAATDSAVTDYPVLLNQHKQVLFSFTAAEYNATGRNLVAEHSLALSTALGNHLVDAVAALITDAFTSETTGAAADKNYGDLTTATRVLNTAGAPDFNRFMWINSGFAEALSNDEVLMDYFQGDKASAYSRWNNVKGFESITEYPAMPANGVNLIGFAFQKNALLLTSRLAINPAELVSAGYPGALNVITDPVSGLSVISNSWIDQGTLGVNTRLILLYGAGRGLVGAGHKFVTS
jgi:hypothetical protein